MPQRGDDVSFWPQMLIHPSHESTAKHVGLSLRHPQVAAGLDNELSCPNNPASRITGSSSMKQRVVGVTVSLNEELFPSATAVDGCGLYYVRSIYVYMSRCLLNCP